jgi:hypothetical protein
MLISGCVNHTTVENITEGEEVLEGTFLLFGCPIIILFDSRASHGFITSACAKREELSLTIAKPSLMIRTPGGWIVANQMARDVPLELDVQMFPTHLVILDGQGIDVILGMSWIKWHKAILDISKQLVYLDSSIYGKVVLHLPVIVYIEASVHHFVAKSIEEIPVVREFTVVFLDDLPGMPPERDIEFKIELQPGTAPIIKSPYKMTWEELAELKIQLKDLGVVQHCSYQRKIKICVYVWIINRWMPSPSRTSIHYPALTSCLTN